MTRNPKTQASTQSRLTGLDLARFVAFVGMVLVNFNIAMSAENENHWLAVVMSSIEGKAAATFVVLAGIGIGMSSIHKNHSQILATNLKRAAFLMLLGLVNSLIFPADILHYYAIYFLFGTLFLKASNRCLIIGIIFLNVIFVVMILTLNYDTGWNWKDYSYADFWTIKGFLRNLLFNGWHPVAPWLGFLFFGVILSRTSLSLIQTHHRLIVFGATCLTVAHVTSSVLTTWLNSIDPEIAILATTSPIPPMPLYFLAGIGAASLTIGLCLWLATITQCSKAFTLMSLAGRQTLTLYIAHIIIGMGTLEAMGMIGGQDSPTVLGAVFLFCSTSIIYSFIWSKYFGRGPMETLMHKLAGAGR